VSTHLETSVAPGRFTTSRLQLETECGAANARALRAVALPSGTPGNRYAPFAILVLRPFEKAHRAFAHEPNPDKSRSPAASHGRRPGEVQCAQILPGSKATKIVGSWPERS
jgi:hypothetical protein